MPIGEASGVFQLFDTAEDIVANRVTTVSSGMWSSGGTTLTQGSATAGFFSSSVQSASSGDYYTDVQQETSSSSTTEVQFSVAYGHHAGSGSKNATDGTNASAAIYSQFKNVIVSPTQTFFKYGASGAELESSSSYFISVSRARMREKIDPGNWEIRLNQPGGSGSQAIRLIDDSEATSDSTIKASQRVFNIVSGSISTGASIIKTTAIAQSDLSYGSSGIGGDNASKRGSLGYFYPELGLIVLNAEAVSASCADGVVATTAGINLTRSSATDDDTSYELVASIISGSHFQARREEQIKSSHYFCRVKSDEYNFSQNPTYFNSTDASLTNNTFVQDPKSYITTVGLYNNNNELLAVAKLSQPLLKSRDREAVIKVRLDF